MKIQNQWWALSSAIALLIGSSCLYQYLSPIPSRHFDRAEVDALLERLTQASSTKVDLDTLATWPAELKNTTLYWPHAYQLSLPELSALTQLIKKCDDKTPPSNARPELQTLWDFEKDLCTLDALEEASLPRQTHPIFGGSLALRALKRGRLSKAWARRHLTHFHLAEIRELKAFGVDIPPALHWLSELSPDQILSVQSHQPLVRGSDHFFIRRNAKTYQLLTTSKAEKILERSRMKLKNTTPKGCVGWFSECLERPSQGLNFRHQALLVGTFSGYLFFLLGLFLWGKNLYRQRQRRAKDRLLVMQTLAHEMRSPAASLQISLESFRREFDQLSSETQVEFLRMCDEIQKMNKVLHASKDYLKKESDFGVFKFKSSSLPSLQEFLEVLCEKFDEPIELRMDADLSLHIDPFWLTFCIENLLKNAFKHGRPPVQIHVQTNEARVFITVQDHGQNSALHIDQLTQPFTKGAQSSGLGLGLSIVRRIAELMDGTLSLKTQPTRLTIDLPWKKSAF